MFGEGFDEREEATLGVEPGIRSQLLLERLQGLHDTGHTKGIVAFGAVERTDDKINDAEMVDLASRLLNGDAFFLLLKTLHQLLSIGILRSHDIGDTEIRKNNGSNR